MERKDKLAIGLFLATVANTTTTKIGLLMPGAADLNPLIENHYLLSNTDEVLMVKMGVILMFSGLYVLCRKWKDESLQTLLGKS